MPKSPRVGGNVNGLHLLHCDWKLQSQPHRRRRRQTHGNDRSSHADTTRHGLPAAVSASLGSTSDFSFAADSTSNGGSNWPVICHSANETQSRQRDKLIVSVLAGPIQLLRLKAQRELRPGAMTQATLTATEQRPRQLLAVNRDLLFHRRPPEPNPRLVDRPATHTCTAASPAPS